MMESRKAFLSVLYLLLYSSFSTADLNPELVNKVEKGIESSTQLLESIAELDTLVKDLDKGGKTIKKVLDVFSKLSKIAAAFSFAGALVSFILAFIPQEDPVLEFMKVQFAEVNRKLDSLGLQIQALGEKIEWVGYASVYSKDESNIKNSWTKLREFIESAGKAGTEKEKTRLAERFTTFYETTGTENSVYNFHSYLTEKNPASLKKNLLILVSQQSKGNFNTLVQFTAYFNSLMVTGMQLNLNYYALKGYDVKLKAEESVKQLSDVQAMIQEVLNECVDNVLVWAESDVEEIGKRTLPDNTNLAFSIKAHLDNKFNWYEWTVLVHDKKDEEDKTYGNSINVIAQNKVVIHILHREKGFSVNQGVKTQMEQEWDSRGKICMDKTHFIWPDVFQSALMAHVQYIHKPDYVETFDHGVLKLKCLINRFELTEYIIFELYLKNQKLEHPPCSDVKCNKGECRQIKDTSTGICKCEKMFYGSSCQESVQDDIDYVIKEANIIGITYQPVPDLTTIYYDLKEMKEYSKKMMSTLREDIQWTQIFVKYFDVIEKFKYFALIHASLNNGTLSQERFVSEADTLTKDNTILFMLYKFDLMMQGAGFGDKGNILHHLRQSILTDETIPAPPCSKSYSERVDYFVRMMFAMEAGAVSAWVKYHLMKLRQGSPVTPKEMEFVPYSLDMNDENDDEVIQIYGENVAKQWRMFNRNGCGLLKAELLTNDYCEKSYHSEDQQEVPLTCQDKYQPFPRTAKCSKGKWGVLPLCYLSPKNGITRCKSVSSPDATHCTATCNHGWSFNDGSTSQTYQCNDQPCPSYAPGDCDRCTGNDGCGNSEVCKNGQCVDGCSVYPCGVNTECSTRSHARRCSCKYPWTIWKTDRDEVEGCRYKELKWVPSTTTNPIPEDAVTSLSGRFVCRARGPDGGWHGGWSSSDNVNTCHYEYNWKEERTQAFEVLVDPCGGNGVEWLSGIHSDTVDIGQAIPWPWITLQVCSEKNSNIPGKLFNTRSGWMCHYATNGKGTRSGDFYSLVKKRCI